MKSPVKNKKTALYVLLIYIVMQLSSYLLLLPFHKLVKAISGKSGQEAAWLTQGWYITLSMGLALIITLIFASRDKPFWKVFPSGRVPFPKIILWGVIGFFLAIIGQSIGVSIEQAIGIDPGSENTMNIAKIAENAPIAIFAIVFFGPALEEFVFRRVVFGSIVQTTNFWVAAFVSAIFFALIHFDFEHIILYTICGLVFAFLYQKTKSIWTSIIAHVLMNAFAMFANLNQEALESFLKQLSQ